MSSWIGFISRLRLVLDPPTTPKSSEVLRFGILGAANIAPQALIKPARYHPEVVVAAIAARDEKRAQVYAKNNNIPIVHKNYDALDCIYIPLPNGLHYEWTVKALKAGKHVLLEKPSVSNATEAETLFRLPLLNHADAPVLLEAFHYRFHPAWQYFITLFDSQNVEHVEVKNALAAGVFKNDDIRFNYSLAGGTLMDFGAYALSSMRAVFGAEPSAITSASYHPMPKGADQQCDSAIFATYEFPNGGTAKISADLQARGGWWLPALTKNWPNLVDVLPKLTLRTKPQEEEQGGAIKVVNQQLVFHNYIGPHFYHRIDITTETVWRDAQDPTKIVTTEKTTEYKKVYKWQHNSPEHKSEEWWSTYRHQLDAFVDRIKKRKGSGAWVESEESIRQMVLIDQTYEKVGLPQRPTSKALGI